MSLLTKTSQNQLKLLQSIDTSIQLPIECTALVSVLVSVLESNFRNKHQPLVLKESQDKERRSAFGSPCGHCTNSCRGDCTDGNVRGISGPKWCRYCVVCPPNDSDLLTRACQQCFFSTTPAFQMISAPTTTNKWSCDLRRRSNIYDDSWTLHISSLSDSVRSFRLRMQGDMTQLQIPNCHSVTPLWTV